MSETHRAKAPASRDRGKRASFDRRTGEVHGSGAGAGNNPDSDEEYDNDLSGDTIRRDEDVSDR